MDDNAAGIASSRMKIRPQQANANNRYGQAMMKWASTTEDLPLTATPAVRHENAHVLITHLHATNTGGKRKRPQSPSSNSSHDGRNTAHQNKRFCQRSSVENRDPRLARLNALRVASEESSDDDVDMDSNAGKDSSIEPDEDGMNEIMSRVEGPHAQGQVEAISLSDNRADLDSQLQRFPVIVENPIPGLVSRQFVDIGMRLKGVLENLINSEGLQSQRLKPRTALATKNEFIGIPGFSTIQLPALLYMGAKKRKQERLGANYLLTTAYFHLLGLRGATALRTGRWLLETQPQATCTLSHFILQLDSIKTRQNQSAKAIFVSHYMACTNRRLYRKEWIGGHLYGKKRIGIAFEVALEVQIQLQKGARSGRSQIAHTRTRHDAYKIAKWLALCQFSELSGNWSLTNSFVHFGPDFCSSDESDDEEEKQHRSKMDGQGMVRPERNRQVSGFLDQLRSVGFYYPRGMTV